MCIDYSSLNKARPKDPFALPRINQVIDSTASYELLSFLDAYSGYHQIKLDSADALKTSFITPFGAYFFITMSFGLKNAGGRSFQGPQVHALPAPILAAPAEKEPLLLYIAATLRSVSTVMVVERPEKGKIQAIERPVYYLSEVLSASKKNYPHYQKMCYGVYFSAKKLKQYF
nr:uncharacterized protein LOC109750975 [Aegilops tauschii subsp. strangulata]